MFWRTPKYTGPERRRQPRWRPRPVRVLLILLGLAAAGYAAAVVWLIAQESRIVFEATKTLGDDRPPFAYEQIDLPRGDGARQFAWVMPQGDGGSAAWVLYLHGNPSTIASPGSIAHYVLLRQLGLSILAPEYRGFGGLDGTPTEAGLAADARAAYDYLRVRGVPPSRIVVYGWSLGAAIAIDLASRVEAAALIIEGAPASIVEINRQRYPFFPVGLIMPHRFESIQKVRRVSAPMLFLHSASDEVVPITEARRLFEAARSDKHFVTVNGGHLDAAATDAARFAEAIRGFLADRDMMNAVRPPATRPEHGAGQDGTQSAGS